MKKPLHERIAAAELRQARLTARLATMKGKQKAADRKRDTHRKIVVGATVLVEMAREPKFAAYLRNMLDKAVARPQDRNAIADLLQPVASTPAPASNANAAPAPAPKEPPPATEPPRAAFAVTLRNNRLG